MTDTVGFWKLAEEDPDRLAVVDPSGREVTYGELFGGEQPPRARPARARPDARATAWPPCCRTASRCSRLYFAAMQAGWYLTPINHHLVGPEIAYIVRRLRGQAPSSATSASRDACAAAARRSRSRAERCFAVGDVDGLPAATPS